MGRLYWSASVLPSVEDIPALRDGLDEAFPLDENRAYLDKLMGAPTYRALPRVTVARLGALALLPSLLTRGGIDHRSVRLARDEHGRPYGQDVSGACPAFDFNLSHTDGHVACALLLGGGRVGMDAEELLTPRRALPLIRHYCTEGEKAALEGLSDGERAAAFTRMWTIREAIAKQEGRGMPLRYDASLIPDSVRVFCGVLASEGTHMAVCVPPHISLSDLIRVPPLSAVQWRLVR